MGRAPTAFASCRRSRAHAAGDRMDQDALAHGESRLQEHRVVGGHEDFGNGGGVHQAHALGNADELPLVHHDVGGHGSARADAHDLVADFDAANLAAQLGHRARELEARNVRNGTGRGRVDAASLQTVGAIEPRCRDLDEDLLRSGVANLEFTEAQDLGTSCLSDANGAAEGRHGPSVEPRRLSQASVVAALAARVAQESMAREACPRTRESMRCTASLLHGSSIMP